MRGETGEKHDEGVCVFSFVTPRPRDYAAVRQPCGYMWYKGFVIHGLGRYGMQSGVGVLWGLCLVGVVCVCLGVFWVVIRSLSLVGVPRASGPGSAFPSSILFYRSAVRVLVLVSCTGWVVLVDSFRTGYEFHESLDSFLGSD